VKAKVFNKVFLASGKCDENFAVKYSTVLEYDESAVYFTLV
jgi:hypothetical protein